MKSGTEAMILLMAIILFTSLQWFWNGGHYKEDLDWVLTMGRNLWAGVTHAGH